MRYLIVTDTGIKDTETNEIRRIGELPWLLSKGEGGVLAGRNLYPLISLLANEMGGDLGWTLKVHAQRQRRREERVGGIIYYSSISYRLPKIGARENRSRPPAIKWLVLNIELFSETEDIEWAATSIMEICHKRGIKGRYSPGSIGSALLRASPEWTKGRRPAPEFISDEARSHLPGNLYTLHRRYNIEKHALYLDQVSSHHTIASQIPLPHPEHLKRRGNSIGDRADVHQYRWLSSINFLQNHIGVIVANVEIDTIPISQQHLYPRWCMKPGLRSVWIWTPELRLLDRRVRIVSVSSALTSTVADPVLKEYADWAMVQLLSQPSPAVKPALLAAYGMLAVRTQRSYTSYSIHSRQPPRRAELCKFPIVEGPVFRSTVERIRTPSIQNVVARGVIEAETLTRSLELARELEGQRLKRGQGKIKVLQVYADGLIIRSPQIPILSSNWKVSAELENVRARTPNSIISDNLLRMPGIPNGRRTTFLARS